MQYFWNKDPTLVLFLSLTNFLWYLFCRVPLNIWFLSLDPLLVFDRSALQYSSLKRIINISLKKQLLIKFLEKCIRRKFLFSETARCMTTVCNFALNKVVLIPHRDIVAQMWYRTLYPNFEFSVILSHTVGPNFGSWSTGLWFGLVVHNGYTSYKIS